MSWVSRRDVLRRSGVAAAGMALPGGLAAVPSPIAALKPMTEGVQTISLDERRARIVRAQRLMAEAGLDAVVLASGTNLAYFTGAEWGLSERFFGLVLSREGEPAWVTPAFEKRRALEQIKIGADVRAWEEHESPSALVSSILRDRGALTGQIGIDESMPFAFAQGRRLHAWSAPLRSPRAAG